MLTAFQGGVLGYWERPSKAVLQFYPCGREVCGKIVRLSPTSGRKTDSRNPDERLRGASVMRAGYWDRLSADRCKSSGWWPSVYDPVSGKTYSGMATSDGDEVKLRGYVGISWFGKSEVWRRVAPVSLESCRM